MFQCTSILFSRSSGGGGGGGGTNLVKSLKNIIITEHAILCGVLAPGQLLSSPMEAVADSLPKHMLFGYVWLVVFSYAMLPSL